MRIGIDAESELTLQEQIKRGLLRAISTGQLARGARAPSTRALARRLGVSRNTVLLAYQQLAAEGLLVGRERSGLFVNVELEPVRSAGGEVAGAREGAASAVWRRRFGRSPEAEVDPAAHRYAFTPGVLAPDLFPAEEWRQAARLTAGLRGIGIWSALPPLQDDPALVDELCGKVLGLRGLSAGPDEVLVTGGVGQSAFLVLQLLLREHRRVSLHEPFGDVLASQVQALGGELVPTEAVSDVALVAGAALGPCSARGPAEARVVAWRAAAVPIVECDAPADGLALTELRPCLRSRAGGEDVVYASGFCPMMESVLGVGFIVAHPRVIAEARRLQGLLGLRPPPQAQRLAAYFLSQGGWHAASRNISRVLAARNVALRDGLNHYLRAAEITPAADGDGYWVRLPPSIDGRAFALAAAELGVALEAVPEQGVPGANLLRMGAGGLDREAMRAALALLREAAVRLVDGEAPAKAPLSGEQIRRTLSGAQLLCRTVYGEPCLIDLHPDGRMAGRAGESERDHGRWSVEGDVWKRRWEQWAYGEEATFQVVLDNDRVLWMREGRVVDQALVVQAPQPEHALELAPQLS